MEESIDDLKVQIQRDQLHTMFLLTVRYIEHVIAYQTEDQPVKFTIAYSGEKDRPNSVVVAMSDKRNSVEKRASIKLSANSFMGDMFNNPSTTPFLVWLLYLGHRNGWADCRTRMKEDITKRLFD